MSMFKITQFLFFFYISVMASETLMVKHSRADAKWKAKMRQNFMSDFYVSLLKFPLQENLRYTPITTETIFQHVSFPVKFFKQSWNVS